MKLKGFKRSPLYSVLLALILQAYPSGIVFAGTYDPDLKASPHVLNVTGYTPSIVIDDFNEPDAVNQPGKWTSGAGRRKSPTPTVMPTAQILHMREAMCSRYGRMKSRLMNGERYPGISISRSTCRT